MSNKFDEDPAYSQVNEAILEREFQLDTTEVRSQEVEEIRQMRQQLVDAAANNADNPDKILLDNIKRANELLDVAHNAILNGGQTNARMYEIAGQLINSVTSAAASIQSGTSFDQKHEYNMKMLEVKEREILVKQAVAANKISGSSKGKVVFTDRETLLKMIEKENMEVEVESAGKEEVVEEV